MTNNYGQIALDVAERLLDPNTVIDAAGAGDAASLSHGLAGTALLHARLSAVGPEFASAAIHHWGAAAQCLRRHPTGYNGIQGGRAGLAASFIVGVPYLPESDQSRSHIERSARWLAADALDIATDYGARPPESGPAWHHYDAITGLAGIGRVLLAATQAGLSEVERGLTAALETLTSILAPRDGARPGWWLADPPGPAADHSGAANTGLAHGVAGPLALLSTAHCAGRSVPGQADAIAHAAEWLLHWRGDDGRWPPTVTGTELDTDSPATATGRTDAWCYGTPGITRALTQAAAALSNPEMRSTAETALDTMASRDPETWDVEGPTLCHGYAGVLQSVPKDHPVAKAAARSVAASFGPTHAFGFQHLDRGQAHDEPGLLTGATGVALALADHEHLPCANAPTSWDSLFNLS